MVATLCVDGNERLIFFQGHRMEQHGGVKKYVQDVTGLGKFDWAEVVRLLVESLDEMQQKLARGDMSNV